MNKDNKTKESREDILERILEETARNPYKPGDIKKRQSEKEKQPVRKEYVQRTQVFSSAEAQAALLEEEEKSKSRRTAPTKTNSEPVPSYQQVRQQQVGKRQSSGRQQSYYQRNQQDDFDEEVSLQRTAADKINRIKSEKAAAAKKAIEDKVELENHIRGQASEVAENRKRIEELKKNIHETEDEIARQEESSNRKNKKKSKRKSKRQIQDNNIIETVEPDENYEDNYEENYEQAYDDDDYDYEDSAEDYQEESDNDNHKEKSYSPLKETDGLLQAVISFIWILYVLFAYIFTVVDVSGDSMLPTLSDNDMILVNNGRYTPKNCDVVVVSGKTAGLFDEDGNVTEKAGIDFKMIKRVIAVSGDTVDIDFENGIVTVNGEALEENYISEPTTRDEGAFEYPLTIPEGYVFVLGDNRNISKDSRHEDVGLIPEDEIMGKAVFRVYPLDDFGGIQ